MELPGTGCRPAAHLILVRSMGCAVEFRLGGASIVSTVESHLALLEELWLAVDEVVHHDDVMFAIVIRPRSNVTGFDPNSRNPGIVKHDAEEGQVSITRRSGDEAAEQQLAVGTEVLDQRAGVAVAFLPARSAAIGLVNVREDRAEAPNRCVDSAVGPWYKEQALGNVASYRSEQPRWAEGPEDFAVGGITE